MSKINLFAFASIMPLVALLFGLRVSPTGAATLSAYHGSIHNHTDYSDGALYPDDAFTLGRARGLDFMAITDHSDSIDNAEWEDTLTQTIRHTVDGVFVALRGAEFTHRNGHINVYNTTRYPTRSNRRYTYADYTPTLTSFYDWLAQNPEAVGMFNHPNGVNFKDWAYHAKAEPMMQLLEVGSAPYNYHVWAEGEYREALDYGWRVGPANNSDTHTTDWGIDTPGRTGIWATGLTYEGVLEAMRAMRLFATEDGNFEIYLKGDNTWMGQTIPNTGAIDFEIYVNDPDGENLVSLMLYTDQGQAVTFTTPFANPYIWTFSLDISQGVHYFFARAEQADGDRAVSAPIWTEGDVDVSPTRLEIVPAQLRVWTPANFTARVTNRGLADATNVTVNFRVGAAIVGSQVIRVPAGGDAFAAVGWTPSVTGLVSISAEISGVPTGDNPDDNVIVEKRNIVTPTITIAPTSPTSYTLTSATQAIEVYFPEPVFTDTVTFVFTPLLTINDVQWTFIALTATLQQDLHHATIYHQPFRYGVEYTLGLAPGGKTVSGKNTRARPFATFKLPSAEIYLPVVVRNL